MDLNIKTNLFNKTRQRSIKIIENLSPEDMNIQSMEDASPIKWHLAHTTWFFEHFVVSKFKKNFIPLMKNIIIYLTHITFSQVQDIKDLKEA